MSVQELYSEYSEQVMHFMATHSDYSDHEDCDGLTTDTNGDLEDWHIDTHSDYNTD